MKLVMGGKIGTTDTWSVGLAFKVLTGGVPTSADMNGFCNAAATLWATDFWDHASGAKANLNATTDWSFCRGYYYPGGSSVSTVSGTKAITADPGTYSTSQIPPQCATVVSLHTGFTGRTNRGRIYLPAIVGLLAGGQSSTSVGASWATQVAQFLTHMNGTSVGAFTFNACIGTGTCPVLTEVAIDSIVDTQRRRRDKQVAAGKSVVAI
jgi:hypothetical protein